MRSISRLALAALLVASMANVASAQVKKRSGAAQGAQQTQGAQQAHGAQRAQSAPNLASDPYGERPRSPGAAPCSERPFALGCDKRGFW